MSDRELPHDRHREDEHVLVRRMVERDQPALAELYRRHGDAVFGLACRVLQDPEQAEEIIQELFLRLWNEPHRFDPQRGSLRSFLFRETQSRCIERRRSDAARRTREVRQQREEREDGYDLEHETWRLIRADGVRDALLLLSDVERDAIHLAYFGGHTYREVAVLLEVSEGTAKSRIRSGLQKLATTLEPLRVGDTR